MLVGSLGIRIEDLIVDGDMMVAESDADEQTIAGKKFEPEAD